MPWPDVAGLRVPLRTRDLFTRDTSRLVLNLRPPPDPLALHLGLDLGALFVGDTRRLRLNLGADVDEGPGGGEEPLPVKGLLVAARTARWSRSVPLRRSWHLQWGGLVPRESVVDVAWGGLEARRARWALAWATPRPERAAAGVAWHASRDRVRAQLTATWRSPELHAASAAMVWGRGEANRRRVLGVAWSSPPSWARDASIAWQGSMPAHIAALAAAYSAPPVHRIGWRIPWGRGDGLPWFIRPPKPTTPPVDPPQFPNGRYVGLDLACRVFDDDARRIPLNLGINACWLGRPKRRTYVVLNEISVVRLPDRLPIHADAVSVSGGRDAAYWEASLTLADPSQLDALAPTATGPRSIEITINGYAWVVQVEAFDSAQVFGATEVSLRARSATAQLGDPYAAPRTREEKQVRTMVQLADAEVDGSDFTVDYGAVDWLVPAGAWYYEGLTPMAALVRIAEASGGVVQSHPTDPVIAIRPRYPASPWDWTITTPDAVIQDDVVTGTRLQLQSRPLYDAVIVAGERVGVAAKVKRAGEAGQTFATQQIDQLITHADGARERGRNVLSDRGGQALVEVDIPLFGGPLQAGQPGLVLPLMLVQRITQSGTWHGLAAAVRIDARRQDKAIDVLQTVTLERHYTDAD